MSDPKGFDTIIGGAGSAGCVLASRLTEDKGRSVLLIEGGPDYPTLDSLPDDIRRGLSVATSHDWNYASLPGKLQRSIPLVRGKLVGGSSAVNVTFAVRGWPDNYDGWAAEGNTEWSFLKALPYFIKLERDLDFENEWHGWDGPLPIRRTKALSRFHTDFVAACVQCGHRRILDHNQPGEVGVGEAPINTVRGIRYSTALTYLARARARRNLKIRVKTLGDSVILKGRRAVGVRLSGGSEVYGDQIIISAGSYGSPAILQRSGIGNPADLRAAGVELLHDLPGVGASLTDHPFISLSFSMRTKTPKNALAFQTMLTIEAGNYRYHIIPTQYDSDSGSQVDFYGALMNPRSRGKLRVKSRNPLAKPLIDLGVLTAREDMPGLLRLVREMWRIAHAGVLKGTIRPQDLTESIVGNDAKLSRWIRARLEVYEHPIGTCRMGSDELAVVDQYGRVRGLENLWVIDASIMPSIPTAQTNVSTIMIAERCTEWL